MTIEFKKEQITKVELNNKRPFVGYFAPNGELIGYNTLLGGGAHDSWRNPVSMAFLSFVSFLVEGTSIQELKEEALFPRMITDNEYPGIEEYVVRGYGINYDINYRSFEEFIESLNNRIKSIETSWQKYGKIESYTLFEYRMLLFFRNAYRNKRFFDSINRKITIKNPEEEKAKIKASYEGGKILDHILEENYRYNLKTELLSHLKDICVQYLGYDSLERFRPDGTYIDIPYKWEEYKKFDFFANPRVITSSYPNVNERYFEYLIRGWKVHQLPRYYYNERTGLYEKCDFYLYYQSDKEKRLGDEIASILDSIPIEEIDTYTKKLYK